MSEYIIKKNQSIISGGSFLSANIEGPSQSTDPKCNGCKLAYILCSTLSRGTATLSNNGRPFDLEGHIESSNCHPTIV